MINQVKLVVRVFMSNWFRCEQGLWYYMDGIYFMFVWSQITFGDLRFYNTCLLLYFLMLWKFLLQILLGFALCLLGLASYIVVNESCFGLDMIYHLFYFHAMFSICGDNNSCRHQLHGNARHRANYKVNVWQP